MENRLFVVALTNTNLYLNRFIFLVIKVLSSVLFTSLKNNTVRELEIVIFLGHTVRFRQ